MRRSIEQLKYGDKVNQLETDAHRLAESFAATRQEAERAVEAGNAYRDLQRSIQETNDLVDEARTAAYDAKTLSEGQVSLVHETIDKCRRASKRKRLSKSREKR